MTNPTPFISKIPIPSKGFTSPPPTVTSYDLVVGGDKENQHPFDADDEVEQSTILRDVDDDDDDMCDLEVYEGDHEEDQHALLQTECGEEDVGLIQNIRKSETETTNNDTTPHEDTDGFVASMADGKSNILVAVRVRPMNPKEMEAKSRQIVRCLDRHMVVLLGKESRANDFLRNKRSGEQRYAFDLAFDQQASQERIFNATTKFLIRGVLDGFNATVFAYGATGAGKTYTMAGTLENPGIMVLTLDHLFREIASSDEYNYKVSLSYLEVYNECIRDLLVPKTEDTEQQSLELREDPLKGMVVAGITELSATSSREIMQLLRMGNKNRTTEPTAANEVSSRSHAVLQVIVEQHEKTAGIHQQVKVGKLSLIDLAGSERASQTQNRGQRLVEGANINRSLLALANCINALGQKVRAHFIPYRDSKLTRLLKDSLGGSCRTVMIANVSPAELSFDETRNTLKYANRAKDIVVQADRHILQVDHHLTKYHEIIAALREEVAHLKLELKAVKGMDEEKKAPVPIVPKHKLMSKNKSIDQLQPLESDPPHIEAARVAWKKLMEERVTIKQALLDHEDGEDKGESSELPRQLESRLTAIKSRLDKQYESLLSACVNHPHLRTRCELEWRGHQLMMDRLQIKQQELVARQLVRQKDLSIMSLQRQLELRDRVIQQQNILLGNAHIPIPEIEPITTTSLTTTQQLPILKPSFSAHALLSSSKSDEEPLSLPDVDGKVKKRIIPTNITSHHKSARSHIHKTSGHTSPTTLLSRSRTDDITIPPSKQKTRAIMRGVTSLHSSSSSSLLPSSQSQSHSRSGSGSHTDDIPIHHSKSATATPTITSPPDSPHQSRLHHKLLTHAQHKQIIMKSRIPATSTSESRPKSQHKHTKSASGSISSSTVVSASVSRVATPREPLIDTIPQPPHMDDDFSDDSWDEDFESNDIHVDTPSQRQTPIQSIISSPIQIHSHTHPKTQTKIKPKPKRTLAKKASKEGRHSRAKKKQLQAAYGLPVL